jgi:hypothetical protein
MWVVTEIVDFTSETVEVFNDFNNTGRCLTWQIYSWY